MKTSDFHFDLPPERIAARPAEPRDSARLMLLDRHSGATRHATFNEISSFLAPRSLLVVNDTQVIPARLVGHKPTGGRFELLLTRKLSEGTGVAGDTEEWEALGRNLAALAPGQLLELGAELGAELLSRGDRGAVRVRLRARGGQSIAALIERVGEVPLPPYIVAARRRAAGPAVATDAAGAADAGAADASDRARYQTVYAAVPGAVAAPTAGLHFTQPLLAALRAAGHDVVTVTLHVGLGTFRPVEAEAVEDHRMDAEAYSIPPETAAAVEAARAAGRPVVAVGTTAVRTLETAARAGDGGRVEPGPGSSELFLYPGARFAVVTDLVTNFHMPSSTLVMLVAAFAGREAILGAYAEAIARGYRFGSYGDAMLVRGTPARAGGASAAGDRR